MKTHASLAKVIGKFISAHPGMSDVNVYIVHRVANIALLIRRNTYYMYNGQQYKAKDHARK